MRKSNYTILGIVILLLVTPALGDDANQSRRHLPTPGITPPEPERRTKRDAPNAQPLPARLDATIRLLEPNESGSTLGVEAGSTLSDEAGSTLSNPAKLNNQAKKKPAVLKTQDRDSNALAWAVVVMSIASTGAIFYVMCKSKTFWNDITYKLLVINWAIGGGVFLIVAGFDQEQINPMLMLLATIVGFVLGHRASGDDLRGQPTQASPTPPAEQPDAA